jgi:hypothetical protein
LPYRTNIAGVVGPFVRVDVDSLEQRIATFASNRGITTDAGWAAELATRFDGTNAPGLSATTRTLLIEFFSNLVKFSATL